jgi:hypothetical protein
MKDLIKKILKEETEEVLVIPSLSFFPNGVEGLKNFIQKKNIKRWSLDDDLNLSQYKGDLTWLEGLVSISGSLFLGGTKIKSLPKLQSVGRSFSLRETQIESLQNLQSVGGFLDLRYTSIKSLDNLQSVGDALDLRYAPIESLGNLQSVGDYLALEETQIKSLGNLQSVGSSLWLNKFLAEKYTDEEIRSMINVDGNIYRE